MSRPHHRPIEPEDPAWEPDISIRRASGDPSVRPRLRFSDAEATSVAIGSRRPPSLSQICILLRYEAGGVFPIPLSLF